MALLPETFLELCQDLVKESPISGTFSTVVGVTNEQERVVNWVATACLEIEAAYLNWNFLSAHAFTFNTIAGIADYPVPADWNWWDSRAFNIPADEQNLDFNPWHIQKLDPTALQAGDPHRFTELPNGTLRLYDTPTSIVTILAPYYKKPTKLADNNDTPLVPARYRKVIIYRALKLYAEYESNDEIDQKAKNGLAYWIPRLQAKELPANQGIQSLNTGMEIAATAASRTSDSLVFFK